jgi:SAM-dependent methyltransferase
MLQLARGKLQGRDLPVTFICQDVLELELPFEFDAAICMHSGLDYILDLRDLARVFASMRRQLRPGGLLAFDKCLDEPGFYRPAYTDSRTIPAGTAVFEYSWDRKRKLFNQRCTVLRMRPDGSPARTQVLHRMKPVALGELVGMVESAGFETLEPPRQFMVSDPGMGIFRAL